MPPIIGEDGWRDIERTFKRMKGWILHQEKYLTSGAMAHFVYERQAVTA